MAKMRDDEELREFLAGQPTSEELREWRRTLENRAAALRRERDSLSEEERVPFERRVRKLEELVVRLREEEEISRFVEQSVRATLAMGAMDEEPEE